MTDSFFGSLPGFLEIAVRYFSILAVIAIPVAVLISYQKTKNETNKAIAAAEKLGLRYINVANEMKKSEKKDSSLPGFFSAWSTWAMEGTYNNVSVQVELIVKSKQHRYIPFNDRVSVSNPTTTTYSRSTAYIASFIKPLPFNIAVHKKIKMPFGLQHVQKTGEIITGDDELDSLITISGSNEKDVKEWLSSSYRKDALKNLYKKIPYAMIDNNEIRFRDPFSKADSDRIKNNLTFLCEAVKKLKYE